MKNDKVKIDVLGSIVDVAIGVACLNFALQAINAFFEAAIWVSLCLHRPKTIEEKRMDMGKEINEPLLFIGGPRLKFNRSHSLQRQQRQLKGPKGLPKVFWISDAVTIVQDNDERAPTAPDDLEPLEPNRNHRG